MQPIRYGVGTYIVRHEAEKDLFAVLERLKEIGYDGVELLGFFGKTPAQIRAKLDELKLAAFGDHVPLEAFAKDAARILAQHKEIGCETLTLSQGTRLKLGTPAFDEMLKSLRSAVAACLEAGITPLYHNHDWDMATTPTYVDLLMEAVDELCLEPDLGWMVFAGADPLPFLERYRDRCPVIHLKDIYAREGGVIGAGKDLGDRKRDPNKADFEFRPTGYGIVNFPRLMPACLACGPRWMVVDHDLAYERDSFADLRLSLEYTKALVGIAG